MSIVRTRQLIDRATVAIGEAASKDERIQLRSMTTFMSIVEQLAGLVSKGETTWKAMRPWAQEIAPKVLAADDVMAAWQRDMGALLAHGGEEGMEAALYRRSQHAFARTLFTGTEVDELLASHEQGTDDREFHDAAERIGAVPPEYVPADHWWWRRVQSADDVVPTVRFFTNAALRPRDEVAGEVVQWLPRQITVEYAGEMPVTGVWQSADGGRRICWYAERCSADVVSAHRERYGDEPFWVVDRGQLNDGRVSVIECDAAGRATGRRVWTFDQAHMPQREEELAPDGSVRVLRTYECTHTGVPYAAVERRPGEPDVVLQRPIAFPVRELAGEPFPCGGTITRGGPRLVQAIAFNSYQARLFAVYRDGDVWKRGLATLATSKAGWPEEMRPILDLEHEKIAPLIQVGALVDRRHQGYSFLGVVEALPEGQTLDDIVLERPLTLADALALAIEIADVARRAHAEGFQLGGIRPELVYVKTHNRRYSLSGIAHRGPAVISTTYSGEQIRWPPVFACDFSSADDTRGLAQLVWYALTGAHPFLAAEDLRWTESWNEFRHRRTRRQPWSGPAVIGPLLERTLFGSDAAPEFETFVGELSRLGT